MQFKRNGNIICFSNTEGIDWNTWHKTLLLFRHLGYDFEDEDQVKEYFDRHCPLNEDQSIAFLQIIGEEHIGERYPKELIEQDNLKAKQFYGTTHSFKKAGYLLTDGDMLDFSEGQWQRTLDHRDITNTINTDSDNYADAMYRFIAYGNIRLFEHGFHIIKPPTNEQWYVIRNFIKQTDSIYVDISNENGYTVRHIEEEMTTTITFQNIKREITEYFNSITI